MRENCTCQNTDIPSRIRSAFFWLEFHAFWCGGTTAKGLATTLAVTRETIQKTVLPAYRQTSGLLPSKRGSHRLAISDHPEGLKFCTHSPREVLALARAEGIRKSCGLEPHCDVKVVDLSLPLEPDTSAFHAVFSAMHQRHSIGLVYQTKAGLSAGVFSPHAFVRTSGRVHARGYWKKDGSHGRFVDLVISRIVESGISPFPYVGADGDSEWHQATLLEFRIREDLPRPQAMAALQEVGSDPFTLKSRKATDSYLIKEIEGRRLEGHDGAVFECTTIQEGAA